MKWCPAACNESIKSRSRSRSKSGAPLGSHQSFDVLGVVRLPQVVSMVVVLQLSHHLVVHCETILLFRGDLASRCRELSQLLHVIDQVLLRFAGIVGAATADHPHALQHLLLGFRRGDPHNPCFFRFCCYLSANTRLSFPLFLVCFVIHELVNVLPGGFCRVAQA